MNKNAIKKFAIDARNKLIASVTDKAGMLGITPDNCSEAITKGTDFEVYKTAAGTEVTLNKKQCKQRRKLVAKIHEKGFEAVVEEVAYTWFNRICAIRFMEVNDYMYPVRVRVLSSEKDGKNEPDVVTMAPDIDWDFTDKERVEIIDAKMNNRLDDLFRMLFIKQCNLLHEVLPGLFEETEDYTEMLLNISFTNEDDVIRMLIDEKRGIPEEDFNVNTIGEDGQPTGQVEIIGWLYQYYNTELKDDTFAKLKKNVKITKERIPAATQLFTPDWIVRYMVENSVGRIWIEHLRAVDPSTDEKAIAEKFGWKYYLPEAEQEETVNVKLAEIRTTYKDLKPTDITCIDPCMGSGHILIAMFDVLMDIYESAGYDKREAAFDIVENNIHGLDIDQRAYQLAYFAVMMKGRGYNRRFLLGRNAKPEPKVYAIIESDDIEKRHLRFFGTSMPEIERIRAEEQMIYLLYTFVDAREYGSILNVDVCDWKLLDRFVNDLNDNGQITFESMGSEETQKILRKLVKIAKNLASKYDAVVTNPPYMKADNMPLKVANYIVNKNENAKYDLYSIFIYRCYEYLQPNGILGMITMHNFMFAPSFEQMRNDIEWWNWISILHLGSRAFSEISGEVVQTAAYIIRKCSLNGYQTDIVDVTKANSSDKKEECYLKKEEMYKFKMNSIDSIPGKAFGYALPQEILNLYKDGKTLSNYGFTKAGIVTGEDDFFVRYWYEVKIEDITFIPLKGNLYKYVLFSKGGSFSKWYGNAQNVLKLQDLYDDSKVNKSVRRGDTKYYYCKGIGWSQMGGGVNKAFSVIENAICKTTTPMLYVYDSNKYNYIIGFLNSNIPSKVLKALNPTLSILTSDIMNLPFRYDEQQLEKINYLVNQNIRLSTEIYSEDETHWQFKKSPLICKGKLEKIINDYAESKKIKIREINENENELNLIYSQIMGFKKLSMNVESYVEDDYQKEVKKIISFFVGCLFGRYSLSIDGIANAGSILDNNKYTLFIPDRDNCIPITDEEYFSDDIVERFVEFVKIVYGADTLEENLDFIAKALGSKGYTSRVVIRNYFLKDFYADHLKVYQKCPIYWLFDSGKQNGFKALIYMHRYDADTVGRVRTDYLHKAQKFVETAMQSAQYTIDNAMSASEKSKATKAVTKYTKQLAEMKIYDEAIAHVANQRIEIDLDDGVKVNYAKFQGVEVAQEGKKALKVDLLAKI